MHLKYLISYVVSINIKYNNNKWYTILCVLLYLGLHVPHYNNFFVKIYADAMGLHKLAAAIGL